MNNSELWENYQKACNDYLHAFCLKHDFDFDDAKSMWVCDTPGTYVLIGDYSVSMETIITDINENVPEHLFFIWYDWSLIDGNNMSYHTWLKVCNELIDNVIKNQGNLKESFNNLMGAMNDYIDTVKTETIKLKDNLIEENRKI